MKQVTRTYSISIVFTYDETRTSDPGELIIDERLVGAVDHMCEHLMFKDINVHESHILCENEVIVDIPQSEVQHEDKV